MSVNDTPATGTALASSATSEVGRTRDSQAVAAIMTRVMVDNDLKQLQPAERLTYYFEVCRSLKLNPLTRPFLFVSLSGKLTLYATSDATNQIRSNKGISARIIGRRWDGEIYTVTAEARRPDGMTNEDEGSVSIGRYIMGEAKANAMMKDVTKAKRRATLGIAGLGVIDESELHSVPDARRVDIDFTTGEILAEHENADFFEDTDQARTLPKSDPATVARLHAGFNEVALMTHKATAVQSLELLSDELKRAVSERLIDRDGDEFAMLRNARQVAAKAIGQLRDTAPLVNEQGEAKSDWRVSGPLKERIKAFVEADRPTRSEFSAIVAEFEDALQGGSIRTNGKTHWELHELFAQRAKAAMPESLVPTGEDPRPKRKPKPAPAPEPEPAQPAAEEVIDTEFSDTPGGSDPFDAAPASGPFADLIELYRVACEAPLNATALAAQIDLADTAMGEFGDFTPKQQAQVNDLSQRAALRLAEKQSGAA